jgi:aspartate racemase
LNHSEVIAMACITSYHYREEVQKLTDAYVVDPVAVTIRAIRLRFPNIKSAGLLATTGTIRSGLFSRAFKEHDLNLVLLDEKDQESYFMNAVYMKNGLKSSEISQESKDLLLTAAARLKEKGAQLLIGGCSEVQLVIKDSVFGLPFVDVVDLMAREVISYCYDTTGSKIPETDLITERW